MNNNNTTRNMAYEKVKVEIPVFITSPKDRRRRAELIERERKDKKHKDDIENKDRRIKLVMEVVVPMFEANLNKSVELNIKEIMMGIYGYPNMGASIGVHEDMMKKIVKKEFRERGYYVSTTYTTIEISTSFSLWAMF